MEERLLSRFSCGLVTDIQPPDLETRMAILQRKVENENIMIGEDISSYIANSVTSNIRELEGSLIRLLAYASLRGEAVTLEMTRRVLSDTFGVRRQAVTIDQIKKKVSEAFDFRPEMMTAKKKTQNIALGRQVAMYLSRILTSNSLKSIGEAFGGRDHSTVIHACTTVERMNRDDQQFRHRVEEISRSITG
jgi:chromosomal replication initiator protein